MEVPSSLKVSILGQIKGNPILYLWKLILKYEQVYTDSGWQIQDNLLVTRMSEYQGRQP